MKEIGYYVGVVGCAVVLLFGIASIIYGVLQPAEFKQWGTYYGIWGIGCAIFGFMGLRMTKRKAKSYKVAGNLLLLIFGIGSAITMISMFIGPALMIISAIIGFLEIS